MHTHADARAHTNTHTQVKCGYNGIGVCDASSVLSDITVFTPM
jgi:hypothetical protein